MCLVAYQTLLLAGSAYADAISRAGERSQRVVHLAAVCLSVAWLAAFCFWRRGIGGLVPDAGGTGRECLAALFCVVASIGLPYVVLGAGSSLVQKWAADALGTGRETFRLYAVSNVGSFAGLLAYPLLIEPYVSQTAQWGGFAAAFAVYMILCAWAARQRPEGVRDAGEAAQDCATARDAPSPLSPDGEAAAQASSHVLQTCLWLLLPCLSTVILDAVTTHLSTDVSPFPLMWVILLGAFLLSYSVGFSRIGEKLMPLWWVLAAAAFCFALHVLRYGRGDNLVFKTNFAAGVLVIFLGGCFLHSWLCRIRPGREKLTRYYLCIAVGGAAGGVLAGVLPPLVFRTIAEYPVALCLLAVAVCSAPLAAWPGVTMRVVNAFLKTAEKGAVAAALAVVCAVACLSVKLHLGSPFPVVHEQGRNFYGAWTVARDVLTVNGDLPLGVEPPKYRVTVLQNGNTTHGLEPEEEVNRFCATTYYGPGGGGLAFTLHPKYAKAGEPMRVGIIGMGAGTQAWYGRPGDTITFYEIDPAVVGAAGKHFTFLSGSKAEVRIEVADARKALEKEFPPREGGGGAFDVLVIDAYSGDSVPFHLITRQAFDLYRRSLAEGGIMALHISNWHLDLLPVCKAAAAHLGLNGLATASKGGIFTWDAEWVFLSEGRLSAPDGVIVRDWDKVREVSLPDDEKGSLLPYLKIK